MKSFSHYRARLGEMDFYDYLNLLQGRAARLKGLLWYAMVFGEFGKRSWLKKPDQIFGSGRIFVGDDVRIEPGAVLYAVKRYGNHKHDGQIRIGAGTYANRQFNATSAFDINVGEGVVFGPNVFLSDFDHGFSEPGEHRLESRLVSKGPIRIGDRCWIGANTFVSSGVTLGSDCVVGANSVVTKSFPPFTMLGGTPARAIRRFCPETREWRQIDAGTR